MQNRQVPSYSQKEYAKKINEYCVCVFVINEGERLLQQLGRMQPVCRGIIDVVVADGGSTDGSTEDEKLKGLGVNTLLVKTGPGKLGSQMRMAFDWALKRGYKGVVCVDGNGKDGIETIPDFVTALQNGVDHVQGSRFISGGHHENTPKSRLLGVKLLHAPLISLASGFHYTDTTNGFRGYSAKLLSSEKIDVFRDCFTGYEFHYYLAIEAARQGFHCSEIPVSRIYPEGEAIPTKISGLKGNLNVLLKLLFSCLHVFAPPKILLNYIHSFIVFVIAVVFGFFAYHSYYSNKYEVVKESSFEQWEQNSEKIVISRIDPKKRKDIKWFSLHHMGSHYIGGQAIADSYICHAIEDSPIEDKIDLLHKIEVLLSVIILSYLCYWIGTELSIIASILFALCAVYCQFMVISTRNLYWSMWTIYLLPALCLCLLRKDERTTSKKDVIPSYLVAVAVSLSIRFTSLFEYASSMMVLSELPLLYYAVKNKWSSKKYFLNALWTGIIAIGVFCFSYCLLFIQLLVYRAQGDLLKAWEFSSRNIKYRVGIGCEDQANVFVHSFLTNLSSLYKRYLDFAAFCSEYDSYNVSTVITWGFILFFIGALVSLLAKQKKDGVIRKYISFGAFAFLSTLLQFIWITTAKGHSYIHTPINWILWNIPLVLIAGLAGYTFSLLLVVAYENIKKIKKDRYTFVLAVSVAIGIAVIYVLYVKSNYSGFEIMLKKFEKEGISIKNTEIQYMIFPDQKKIFFKIPNKQTESHTFFYHIYPLFEDDLKPVRKQYRFNNQDFSIKGKSNEAFVPKSPCSNSQYEIIQCRLPSYQYAKIRIGQYDSKQSYWTLELKKEIPETRKFLICNLSDKNWDKGRNKGNKKCVLFKTTQFIFPGDYVTFPNKSTDFVENVKVVGQYLYVFLGKEAPSFDPNQPCVFSKRKPEALLKQEPKTLK